MTTKKSRGSATLRLRGEAHDQIEKLVDLIGRNGWKVAGRDSSEQVTKESVTAYAVTVLSEKAAKKRAAA